MSEVEVICATMHQSDLSKYKEMNINSNVIFANQSDTYAYEESTINGNRVRMITTPERGVGKNRNYGLLHAKDEICIFADDDVIYSNDYVEKIQKAFKELPKADIVIFNIESDGNRKQKSNNSIKRCRVWNVLRYGAPRIAFRLNSIRKANIWFSLLFGGGCKYPSGEDSIWLVEALKKGLRIYTYPITLGTLKQGESTWFNGYNNEYFFGRGALVQASIPKMKYLLFVYYVIRFSGGKTTLSPYEIFTFLELGAKKYIEGKVFNDLKE